MLNIEPIMNQTQVPALPEFGDSLLGILAAIALSVVLASLAFALANWPAETLRWTALPMGMTLPDPG